MKNPLQPIIKDSRGVYRFKENSLVRYLLEHGGIDMNHLAGVKASQTDKEQFAMLIGYSVSGFGDLSYVSDETYTRADAIVERMFNEKN